MATATTRTYPATTENRSRGFTLIEIVVVITIIAVAAAIAIPSLGAGARQREVRRTLQTFVSTVRRASSVSVFQRRPVELTIHPREGRYVVATRGSQRMEARSPAAAEGARGAARSSRLRPESTSDDAEGSENEKSFGVDLPALASFGEVRGGRDLGPEGIVFDFYPNGSSSGGRIELVFDARSGRPDSYIVVVDQLVSSISLEDE